MGEALHRLTHHNHAIQCRIYAPVGTHKDLLPYLVRWLLENGANSSFANQIINPYISPERVAADLFASYMAYGKTPATDRQLCLPERHNSMGCDLADFETQSQINQRRYHFAG